MSKKNIFSGIVEKSKENKVSEEDLNQNSTISSLMKKNSKVERLNILDDLSKKKSVSKGNNTAYFDDIDPRECQIWYRQSRFFELLDEKQCEDLISDFKGHIGQKIPITIRQIPVGVNKDNDNIKYEVVAGSRRLWSAVYVQNQFNEKFRLKVILKTLDDKQAAVECEKENEREDLSAFEKGMFYYNLLEQNIFENHRQLSDTLNIPKTTLHELLEYGKLDKILVDIFSDPREIKKSWVKCLNQLGANIVSKKAILNKINDIKTSTLKYTDQKIFNILKNIGVKAVELPSTNKFKEISKEIKDPKNKRVIIKMERTRTNKIRVSIDNKISMGKKDILKNISEFLDDCSK